MRELLLLLILSGAAAAQYAWSGILDASRATDWTTAGIPGGIPNRDHVCQTVAMTAGSAAAAANATAIQNAVHACNNSGQLVMIPAGTWYTNAFAVSSATNLNNNVTLSGAGPDQTILLMQSVMPCFEHADVCIAGTGGGQTYASGADWTANYNQGATTITLGAWTGSPTPGVGDLIVVDQRDDSFSICPQVRAVQGGSWASNIATLTVGQPQTGFAQGGAITVSGISPSGFNGTFTVTSTNSTSGTVSYALTTNPGAWVSGGSISGAGSCANLSGATESGSTVTLTTTLPHGFAAGQTVMVGGVANPPASNGALGGLLTQGFMLPTSATCSAGVVTMSYGQSFGALGPITATIVSGGSWANGIQTLYLNPNPLAGADNGIRTITIAGTGTSLDGGTYRLTLAYSAYVQFLLPAAPSAQPTTGTAHWGGDTIWISGSNGIYSGVHQVTASGVSGQLNLQYSATCGSDVFAAGNYMLSPISYPGHWTITDVGCNVAGTYTSSSGCGSNPINAFRYTSPITGLPTSGGGQASVDTGGFHTGCVGGANCSSEAGSGWPESSSRVCPFVQYGQGGAGNGICATGEYSFRNQHEIHVITAISGSSYTISPPIQASNWRSARHPGAYFMGANKWITGVSIENLTVDSANDNPGSFVVGAIAMSMTYRCWVKNVRTVHSHRNHIWFASPAFQNAVVDSYFWGSPGYTKSYGVEDDATATLMQNNICEHVVSCIMVGGSEGAVYSYNFARDTGYNPTDWNIGIYSFNHSSAFYNLYEGNNGNLAGFDSTHGLSDANTVLRNRFVGNDYPYRASALIAQAVSAHSRAVNYLGNVLGTSTWQPSGHYMSPTLFVSGYVYNMPVWTNTGVFPDPLTLSTSMLWGNYDVATGATRWCGNSSSPGWTTTCASTSEVPTTATFALNANPVPSTTVLPSSMYLSTQPIWWATAWGTAGWPAIGPDVTASGSLNATCTGGAVACDGVNNLSYQIPAQTCWLNTPVDPAYQTTLTPTSFTWASGVVTVTVSNSLVASNTVTISGVSPAGYNGVYVVSSVNTSSPPSTSFTYPLPTNPGGTGSGGTVTWPNIKLYNAANCYTAAYAPTPPPSTSPSKINGTGKITGNGKIT